MLSTVLEGDPSISSGGWLDLHTGQVYDDDATDPMMLGQDAAMDVHAPPGRWLRCECTGSRNGWGDMAAFAQRQRDTALREHLQRAIKGAGAFARFHDLVHDQQIAQQWDLFCGDRQLGEARQFLAAEGIRVL